MNEPTELTADIILNGIALHPGVRSEIERRIIACWSAFDASLARLTADVAAAERRAEQAERAAAAERAKRAELEAGIRELAGRRTWRG